MEASRITIVTTGAYQHAWGDTFPVESRYQELVNSERLPDTQLLQVDGFTVVESRFQPRLVVVWNLAGRHLTQQPTQAEAEQIAAQGLLVGLRSEFDDRQPSGWQALYPAKPGERLYPSTLLWLPEETRVCLMPATRGIASITTKVLLIPAK